jgi:hypothetical protein
LFKAAVRAVVVRLNPEPQSEARKRRSGEKEGGGPIRMRPAVRAADRPAARGRYATLWAKAPKTAAKLRRRFTRAANDATADPVQDAALHLSDTMQLVQFWQSNAALDMPLDDYSGPQQDSYFPQP